MNPYVERLGILFLNFSTVFVYHTRGVYPDSMGNTHWNNFSLIISIPGYFVHEILRRGGNADTTPLPVPYFSPVNTPLNQRTHFLTNTNGVSFLCFTNT